MCLKSTVNLNFAILFALHSKVLYEIKHSQQIAKISQQLYYMLKVDSKSKVYFSNVFKALLWQNVHFWDHRFTTHEVLFVCVLNYFLLVFLSFFYNRFILRLKEHNILHIKFSFGSHQTSYWPWFCENAYIL